MISKYQLRYAAGKYWLLDMSQRGLKYVGPVCINEGAAYLWEMLSQGKTKKQMVEHLCKEFGLPREEASDDVNMFYEQLKEQGIVPE